MAQTREQQLINLLESEITDMANTQLRYAETLESTEIFSDEEIAEVQKNYEVVVTLERIKRK